MRGFGGNSNFPPGHPTGVDHGEEDEIYYCEPCNYLLRKNEINEHENSWQHKKAAKLFGGNPIQRDLCESCGEPCTHIDYDRSVNYTQAFCSKHGM